jgi:hypothetical protein
MYGNYGLSYIYRLGIIIDYILRDDFFKCFNRWDTDVVEGDYKYNLYSIVNYKESILNKYDYHIIIPLIYKINYIYTE